MHLRQNMCKYNKENGHKISDVYTNDNFQVMSDKISIYEILNPQNQF
jgi:hypothetical protein